jgi:hypothetical protein
MHSASGTGISGSTNAAQPAVAFSGGNIYTAWHRTVGSVQSIVAATNANGSAWQPLSIDAPDSNGTSSNPQLADLNDTQHAILREAP